MTPDNNNFCKAPIMQAILKDNYYDLDNSFRKSYTLNLYLLDTKNNISFVFPKIVFHCFNSK